MPERGARWHLSQEAKDHLSNWYTGDETYTRLHTYAYDLKHTLVEREGWDQIKALVGLQVTRLIYKLRGYPTERMDHVTKIVQEDLRLPNDIKLPTF